MSNPQAEKFSLDNLARLQQMKINARLTALQSAQTLMHAHNYTGTVDHLTLLAMASDLAAYIMDNVEAESAEAIEAAKLKMSGPKIVRP